VHPGRHRPLRAPDPPASRKESRHPPQVTVDYCSSRGELPDASSAAGSRAQRPLRPGAAAACARRHPQRRRANALDLRRRSAGRSTTLTTSRRPSISTSTCRRASASRSTVRQRTPIVVVSRRHRSTTFCSASVAAAGARPARYGRPCPPGQGVASSTPSAARSLSSAAARSRATGRRPRGELDEPFDDGAGNPCRSVLEAQHAQAVRPHTRLRVPKPTPLARRMPLAAGTRGSAARIAAPVRRHPLAAMPSSWTAKPSSSRSVAGAGTRQLAVRRAHRAAASGRGPQLAPRRSRASSR